MAGENSLVIWALSDGAPGHWSQSQGIVDAVAAERAVQVERIYLRIRSRFWRRLGRVLLPWIRRPAWWLERVCDLRLPAGRPDLIISSGGNTLLANALLARQFRAPNAYSGTLKGHDPGQYRVVFTVVPLSVPSNCVLPLPPVPNELIQARFEKSDGNKICVLIGGNGAGYEYDQSDWKRIASYIEDLAKSRNMQLLIASSRRTGVSAEEVISTELSPDYVERAVWWSKDKSAVVKEFIARSDYVIVTEDSLTMIAEAIYSGRFVLTVRSHKFAPNKNDEIALRKYESSGFIKRIDSLGGAGSECCEFSVRKIPDVQGLIFSAIRDAMR